MKAHHEPLQNIQDSKSTMTPQSQGYGVTGSQGHKARRSQGHNVRVYRGVYSIQGVGIVGNIKSGWVRGDNLYPNIRTERPRRNVVARQCCLV